MNTAIPSSDDFADRLARPHHRDAVARVVGWLARRPSTLGVVVAGSVARGGEDASSDVDIMIVVPDADCARRSAKGRLTFLEPAALLACRYPGGYVDGKYVCPAFMREVAERGSEPARFAFEGAFVAWERDPGTTRLDEAIRLAARYPEEGVDDRIRRFAAQVEAWHWYLGEGLKRSDPYLVARAATETVLFAGRIVLARNRLLFPYHKWFLRAIESAARKPRDFAALCERALRDRDAPSARSLYDAVRRYERWPVGRYEWPRAFMEDSELAWRRGGSPVGDL